MSAPDCVEQLYLFGNLPLVGPLVILRSQGRLVLLLLCYGTRGVYYNLCNML